MNKLGYYIVILGLVIINIVLLFMSNNKTNKMLFQHKIVNEKLILTKNRQAILDQNNNLYLKNELLPINNSCIFYGNDSISKKLLFEDIDSPVLVFRFSGNACDLCIDFGINRLKSNFSNYGSNNNIIILGTDINPRVREKYYDKRVANYCAKTKTIGLPLEDHQIPFFFLIDKDKKAKMVFVPDKALPEMTDNYLKNIKERFLD